MPPLLISVLNFTLIAIFIGAAAVGFWAIHHMLLRARERGGRFWAFNPLAQFAGMTMRHTLIFFVTWFVGAAAVIGLIVLNHGWDELRDAFAGIRAGPPKR